MTPGECVVPLAVYDPRAATALETRCFDGAVIVREMSINHIVHSIQKHVQYYNQMYSLHNREAIF